jgi:hypothetical protein
MSTAGAPSAREAATADFFGNGEVAGMLVWGGWTGGPYAGDGAIFDVSGADWRPLPQAGAPSPRQDHVGVSLGDTYVVWGGCGNDTCKDLYGDGAALVAEGSALSWRPIAATDVLAPRRGATGVMLRHGVLIWGGKTASGETDTGAILYP